MLKLGLIALGALFGAMAVAEANEALVKQRAALARVTFPEWQAMPLHNNFDVEPGDLIDVLDEAPLLKHSVCFPSLETTNAFAGKRQEVDLRLDRSTSTELGLSGEAMAVPASARAELQREAGRSARLFVVRNADDFPKAAP